VASTLLVTGSLALEQQQPSAKVKGETVARVYYDGVLVEERRIE
jgi:hypothetical protein